MNRDTTDIIKSCTKYLTFLYLYDNSSIVGKNVVSFTHNSQCEWPAVMINGFPNPLSVMGNRATRKRKAWVTQNQVQKGVLSRHLCKISKYRLGLSSLKLYIRTSVWNQFDNFLKILSKILIIIHLRHFTCLQLATFYQHK